MKNITIAFLLTIGFLQNAFAQEKIPQNIAYITVKDTVVIKTIRNAIKQRENIDSAYRSHGYVRILIREFGRGDTSMSYFIQPSMYAIHKDAIDEVYPEYYTFIDGRLVTFSTFISSGYVFQKFYTVETKNSIQSLVNSTLEKPHKETFMGIHGSVETERYGNHDFIPFGGTHLYILRHNKPPIITDKEDY